MSELRKDPVTGRWVIISTERGQRPTDFDDHPRAVGSRFCPFCAGNEDKTPAEIVAVRPDGSAPNGPGWRVRVVPNKFPALKIEGELDPGAQGLYDRMNGIGAHEVIIETAGHTADLSQLEPEALRDVLHVYRERLRDLKRDPRFHYLMLFKNHGQAAGASLEHSHSQIIATPVVPKRVQEELEGAARHHRLHERCIFCDIIAQERSQGLRIVTENEYCVSFAPFASRFPFETWLLPREHQSHFEEAPAEELAAVAQALGLTLRRIGAALGAPPYNFILHTAPARDAALAHYHWHFEIMPTVTRVAGFEWGTGFYINPTTPEEAAACLREIDRAGA